MDHAGRVNGFMTTGKRVVIEGDSLPDLFIGASWKVYAGTIPFDKPVQSYRLELNEAADDSQKDGII
jgi:hypothetical protein